MLSSASGKSIAWVLPEGHLGVPKELNGLDITVYRLRSHAKVNRVRPIHWGVIAWDWRRADRSSAKRHPELVLSSINDLPSGPKDIPVIVSGPRALADSICREFDRAVFWLSIDGNGATDPQAVWASWLAGVPSISIELVSCRDGKCGDRFGARELRVHRSSPALTHTSLLRASIALVERLAVRAGPEQAMDVQPVFQARPATRPSLTRSCFQPLRISLRIVCRTLWNRLTRAHRFNGHWVIGIGESPESRSKDSLPKLPQFRDFHWIEPGSHRFVADPFLLRVGDILTLFFEELSYSDWKGRLKALPLHRTGLPAGPEVTVLEKPYHLSFPFVFEHPSEPGFVFLLPEQAQSGNTVLYKSVKPAEPSAIQFHEDTTLLPGFPGIDPVISEWNGHFYLFVSNGSYGNYDNNLQLFVSENLRGPYRAHPKSPIRSGLRGSRMAGPLVKFGSDLYRPGQDCQSSYGARIILHRVDLLSPTNYRETEVKIFSPDPASSCRLGSHTVMWYEGLVAIDGLRQIPVSRETER